MAWSLKDTELRVLLLLVNQTYGWQKDGKATLLTYRTLIQRFGRGNDAIAKALASLKRQGLILNLRSEAQRRQWKSENKHTGKRRATIYKEKE